MRAPLFKFITVAFALAIGVTEVKSEGSQLDATAFSDLSKEAARVKAKALAERDFRTNNYRILVAGRRAQNTPHDILLKKKYNVSVYPFAGCVVTDGIIGAIDGYNSTMKPMLIQKFGHDIFKEAEQAR